MGLIVIVGAGSGISRAAAERFGKEGFKVALIARSEDKLKNLAAGLKEKNIDAVYKTGDAGNYDSLLNAISEIKNSEGIPDLFLYNASALTIKDILSEDWDSLRNDLDVSAGGYFNMMKIAMPDYLKENKGKLFLTGGGLSLEGDPNCSSLSAGKAAVRNLFQAYVKKAKGTQLHIAHLMVCGYVREEDPKYNPDSIAEEYWKLFIQKPGEFVNEVIY